MTRPDAFAMGRSDLNLFLFAEIGVEPNGMPLSVVSALARLGGGRLAGGAAAGAAAQCGHGRRSGDAELGLAARVDPGRGADVGLRRPVRHRAGAARAGFERTGAAGARPARDPSELMAEDLKAGPVLVPAAAPSPGAVAVAVVPLTPNLPAVIPTPPAAPAPLGWKRPLLLALVLAIAAGGGTYWWLNRAPGMPAGIAFGNGRLEADEIDIDTKFAGRIASLAVDEGAVVTALQTVGMMDSQDLQASLAQSQALAMQAQHAVQQAMATLATQRTQVVLARQELDRATTLAKTGFETREMVDTRQQAFNGATATVNASIAAVGAAAQQAVVLGQVNIGYNTLTAPRAGTIEYRIANVGEVPPAGGKVFTMLDRNDVYIDVYLSTADAGHTRIGSDARILLDAYPDHPIAASVVFVAAQAQFTPKTVETQNERDSLMFRVRVRIDPAVLAANATPVKSGLPGLAYVRTDPKTAWPVKLQGSAPK